jgi:hypothetical protein
LTCLSNAKPIVAFVGDPMVSTFAGIELNYSSVAVGGELTPTSAVVPNVINIPV